MSIVDRAFNLELWLFRIQFIHKITSLEPQITGISRAHQFYAITLFDKFLRRKSEENLQEQCLSYQSTLPYCMACINLVSKFDSQINHKIANLCRFFTYEGDTQSMKQSYLKAESEILQSFDFEIPSQTFFMSFQQESSKNEISQKHRVYILKIFLVGLQYSTQLTENPSFGERILKKYIYKNNEDRQIDEYCSRIIEWSKTQVKKE